MSGIEVASLVLTIFPLVITGLRQVPEGAGTIKSWKQYHVELRKYSRTLGTQRVFFRNIISNLFDGIVESNDSLEALLEDPKGAFSHGSHYEDALKNRLGDSYDSFLLIVEDMLENLKTIRKELNIDENGKIMWDGYSFIKRQGQKLKLMTHKNIYAESITQIKESIRELRQFTEDGLNHESSKKRRRLGRDGAEFKAIRRHARSLYNVIVTGRSWNCLCPAYHVASLRLEPFLVCAISPTPLEKASVHLCHTLLVVVDCPDQGLANPALEQWRENNEDYSRTRATNPKFRVFLSNEQITHNQQIKWKSYQIEVESMETSFGHSATEAGVEGQALDFASQSITHSSKPKYTDKKKTVRFAALPASSISQNRPTVASTPSDTSIHRITDICRALNDARGVSQGVGFLKDESVGQFRHDIHVVSEQIWCEAGIRSLEYMLESAHQSQSGTSLSRGDRLHIAATLASSVLQLDGTFWLKGQWRSRDIIFLPSPGGNAVAQRVDLSHLYIPWKVVPNGDNIELSTGSDESCAMRHIRHGHLYALGCTLIELSLNQRLCDMRAPKDGLPIEAFTEYNTAMRLVDKVYEKSGDEYGAVVHKCLTCPFKLRDLRNLSFDNEEFQDAVLDEVLMPLRQDLQHFNGKDRIE